MHQAIHPITTDEYIEWFIALMSDAEEDPNRIPDEDG